MSKADYFKKHRAGDRLVKCDLPPDSGLPELYAVAIMHHEFADMCDVVEKDGKKDAVVNYVKAMIRSIVTFDGLPFFTDADTKGLTELGVAGAGPFVTAINEANGLNAPKAPTAEPQSNSASPSGSASPPLN